MRAPIQASIERAWREVAVIEAAFAQGEIDEAEWHARMANLCVPAYLAGEDPRAQSGYTGTKTDWRQARELVADAIPRSGSFLDVGCANGHLMESVHTWCAERGLVVEPFGVDIASDLVALARARLPQWAARICEGNAAVWTPPVRFDFVRSGLEYVPRARRRAFVEHLSRNFLLPNGRLLIGAYSEERDETRTGPSLEDELRNGDFAPSGRIERPHPRDDRVVRRLILLRSTMTLVVIFGPPAVGKMAVGLELEQITGLRLFHNHMSADVVMQFFAFGEPAYGRLVSEFRTRLCEEVAASTLPGLIFTYVWALDDARDKAFVDRLAGIFTTRSRDVYFAELAASLDERLRRNESPLRLAHKAPKRDVARSREQLLDTERKYRLNSNEDFFYPDRHLRIENTALSAREAAERIPQHFPLPSKPNAPA